MKIDSIKIAPLDVLLTKPFKVAIGTKTHAKNIIVCIETDNGLTGWGEASPSPYITGDTQAMSLAAAGELAAGLIGNDPRSVGAHARAMRRQIAGAPSARAALDMALNDLAAKAAGLPLYLYLGGEKRPLRTDATIGLQDGPAETAAAAEDFITDGFTEIKLKVGRPGSMDVDHVRAVRETVGPAITLRIDANQGWDFPQAVASITAMQAFDIEYAEQPLHHADLIGLRTLRETVQTPICLDESVFDENDARAAIAHEAADYINIKLGKAGGIWSALSICAQAEAAQKKCMIGCFAETRLGLAAAAHLAMARPNIAFLDLDSIFHFASDPMQGDVAITRKQGGEITLPNAPGIGVQPDENEIGNWRIVN